MIPKRAQTHKVKGKEKQITLTLLIYVVYVWDYQSRIVTEKLIISQWVIAYSNCHMQTFFSEKDHYLLQIFQCSLHPMHSTSYNASVPVCGSKHLRKLDKRNFFTV